MRIIIFEALQQAFIFEAENQLCLNNHTMNNGTVKFFNDSKGYGFITPDNGGKDVFVHANGLIDDIREGDKVSYEIEDGRKGPNAVDVRVL